MRRDITIKIKVTGSSFKEDPRPELADLFADLAARFRTRTRVDDYHGQKLLLEDGQAVGDIQVEEADSWS